MHEAALRIFQCNDVSLRCVEELQSGLRMNGCTALFVGDLELAHAIVLDSTLDPSGRGVQLLEECPGSFPIQYYHNSSMWESGLWLQEMRDHGGV